jgi:hypothetical protein
MGSPKIPKPPPPAPPPISSTGPEKVAADLEARRRQGKRYDFSNTILAPQGTLKSTLG